MLKEILFCTITEKRRIFHGGLGKVVTLLVTRFIEGEALVLRRMGFSYSELR